MTARHFIDAARARHWKFFGECDPLFGGFAPRTPFVVAETQLNHPNWVRLQMPGRDPPAFIKVAGDEFSLLFEPISIAAGAPRLPMPNLADIFDKLSKRQRAAGDALAAMREARAQLQRDALLGHVWGTVAILANAALLPLNVVINAFDVKAGVSIYQALVKQVYNMVARSGTRLDSKTAQAMLSSLKAAIVEELKHRNLVSHIPGVNIVAGMAEDAIALIEVLSLVSEGDRGNGNILRQVDRRIQQAMHEFNRLGTDMDRLLTEMDRRGRTA